MIRSERKKWRLENKERVEVGFVREECMWTVNLRSVVV